MRCIFLCEYPDLGRTYKINADQKMKAEWFEDLGISDKNEDYFYNKKNTRSTELYERGSRDAEKERGVA